MGKQNERRLNRPGSSEELALLRLVRCELSRLRYHGYSLLCPLTYAG